MSNLFSRPLRQQVEVRSSEQYRNVPSSTVNISPDIGRNEREGRSHYINGEVREPPHEYLNTGLSQIDETAALIEFLHHPPGSQSSNGRSQVNIYVFTLFITNVHSHQDLI